MSNYVRNQNSVRRWDTVLKNLRDDVARLKRLTLRGINNRNLITNSRGRVVNGGIPSTQQVTTVQQTSSIYIGRLHVDNSISIYEQHTEHIENEDWEINFESPVNNNVLLQNGHLFKLPNNIGEIDITGKKVYLKVDLSISGVTIFDDNGEPIFRISLTKNGTDENDAISSSQLGTSIITSSDALGSIISLQINDILILESGDTIDVVLQTGDNMKFDLINDKTLSYINFNIIKIE